MTDFAAVMLLGFGGPEAPDQVRPFLDRVLEGRTIPRERYEAVVAHYHEIGGASPFNALTRRQGQGLAAELHRLGCALPVEPAFLNAAPSIPDVLERYASADAKKIFAVPLAPFQGSASAGKYVAAADRAVAQMGASAPEMHYAGPFYDDPLIVRAHAQRLEEALVALRKTSFDEVRVVFTAHSIPVRDPSAEQYVQEFSAMAQAIAKEAGLASGELAYQSRSGSPRDPWLEPDIGDALKNIAESGASDVIVSPIGFLCDHVEVLYDLDVAAKRKANELGLSMQRAEAINDHPLFVELLAKRVMEAIQCASLS